MEAQEPTPLTAAEPEKCSKCDGPIDTKGSPRWCKKCRAKYQAEYQETRAELARAKDFAEGVTAMRHTLATEFARHGRVGFTGAEVAFAIENAPAPLPSK